MLRDDLLTSLLSPSSERHRGGRSYPREKAALEVRRRVNVCAQSFRATSTAWTVSAMELPRRSWFGPRVFTHANAMEQPLRCGTQAIQIEAVVTMKRSRTEYAFESPPFRNYYPFSAHFTAGNGSPRRSACGSRDAQTAVNLNQLKLPFSKPN